MIKKFEKEVELISSNNSINEKLIIFSLYNEFYNDILSLTDEEFSNHYLLFIEKTFELVISSLNLKENINISAKQFMNIYFQTLKKSKLSSMPQVNKIIKKYEDNINSFINDSEYVKVIDKFNTIPFNIKVNIMVQFREYINDVYNNIINLYGNENSKELRQNILEMLTIKLDDYLSENTEKYHNDDNIICNLKTSMMAFTKNYLITKIENNNISLMDFEDEETKQFFSTFNEVEKKIWLMGAIYNIAGYERNDKSSNHERIKEICDLLGISRLKYTKSALSMGIHSIKMMKESMNEINKEEVDRDLPVKRK